MSKSKKRSRDKERKRLKARKTRLASRPSQAPDLLVNSADKARAESLVTEFRDMTTAHEKPAEPAQEKDATDDWWDEFSAAGPERKLEVLRNKLSEEPCDEDWLELVYPESLDDARADIARMA